MMPEKLEIPNETSDSGCLGRWCARLQKKNKAQQALIEQLKMPARPRRNMCERIKNNILAIEARVPPRFRNGAAAQRETAFERLNYIITSFEELPKGDRR